MFHVTRLKLFFGSAEEAFRLAQLDADQHVIQAILAYDGNPEKRRDMRFLVHFADDSKHWLQWSKDISDTVQFEDFAANDQSSPYCFSRPPLPQRMSKHLPGLPSPSWNPVTQYSWTSVPLVQHGTVA
jgi:hypothetical protein